MLADCADVRTGRVARGVQLVCAAERLARLARGAATDADAVDAIRKALEEILN